jgi:Fe-S cluster biogenesis protein NfuA
VKWLERILGSDRDAHEPPRGDPERIAQVERVLARVAPILAADGGEVRLVEVDGDAVVLAWGGACRSCGARSETLQRGLEPELRANLPWLADVRSAS